MQRLKRYFKKLKRAANRFYTIYWRQLLEKRHKNGKKYLFFKGEKQYSDTLIVSFAAFAPNGSRYNYVRALRDIKCHKLFLLDDGAENHSGTYLIDKDSHDKAHEIIEEIIKKYNVKRQFFIGSSKGGYCALDFSFCFPNTVCCIAAPQYFVGDYMNTESKLPNLRAAIEGEITESSLEEINNRLRNIIKTSPIRPLRAYLHYSDKEHTYEEHVKFMLEDLHRGGIPVEEDAMHYASHDELVNYFPAYLNKIMKKHIVLLSEL